MVAFDQDDVVATASGTALAAMFSPSEVFLVNAISPGFALNSAAMSKAFDVAAVRSEFPVTKRMLYLDSAHQTPLAASVRAALVVR